jgi:2-polyprenyl-3-methyl-5-hydroxy-6-metoxy-1,4-benzoquinol methylase
MDYNKIFYEIKNKSKIVKNNYDFVGWGSKKSQMIRFYQLEKFCNIEKKTILDIGCGRGDFFKYLKRKKIKSFTGIDMNKDFVNFCEKKYKSKNVKFFNKNFLDLKFKKKYDIVFMSGLLNLPFDNNFETLEKIIFKMFNLSKYCILFNFLSTQSNKIFVNQNYYDATKILKLVEKISNNYLLNSNYLSHDKTFIVFKKHL